MAPAPHEPYLEVVVPVGNRTRAAIWAAVVLIIAATLWSVIPGNSTDSALIPEFSGNGLHRGDTVARVGDYVLYDTDLALIRADEGAAETWRRDQLLACSALEAGLENPAISSFVAERAVQVYLRDLMVESIVESIRYPSEQEIIVHMQSDPVLYFIERHYYQIIVADSSMADSIHTRLGWGQNFQVTARNISIGQKAGIGGDLGFLTGAEILAQGLPEEVAKLDGLSSVIQSNIGWHIFKAAETRALEDSTRAIQSTGQLIYETRIQASVDSVLQAAEERLSAEVGL